MGINIVPAGGDSFRLRQTITASGTVDLGQVRRAFIVLAGGGGSGGNGSGTSAGGGGGSGGVIAGTMFAKWLNFQIGAGGASISANATSGNDGSPSYMIIPITQRSAYSGSTSNTYRSAQFIVACGGQKGWAAVATQGTGNLCFANVTTPTVTNFTSSGMTKVFGNSGQAGGGGAGNGATGMLAAGNTILDPSTIPFLNGWEHNNATTNTANDALPSVNSYIPSFTDPTVQSSWFLDTSSGITTYAGARVKWSTNTSAAAYHPGGDGQTTSADGYTGGAGMFIGSGGGGGGGTNRVGGSGGGGRWFLAGLGGAGTSGGGGGGGGAGVAGAGVDGSASAGGTGGAGGAGGLGGGGGGGGGGNTSGSATRSTGKGGDGVALIFY
jgi:hypothetical protein